MYMLMCAVTIDYSNTAGVAKIWKVSQAHRIPAKNTSFCPCYGQYGMFGTLFPLVEDDTEECIRKNMLLHQIPSVITEKNRRFEMVAG